jgi:hypothetical protein
MHITFFTEHTSFFYFKPIVSRHPLRVKNSCFFAAYSKAASDASLAAEKSVPFGTL